MKNLLIKNKCDRIAYNITKSEKDRKGWGKEDG